MFRKAIENEGGQPIFEVNVQIMEKETKKKGRDRKKEREGRGKGKKNSVSHGPFLMPKVIVFVIVLLAFVNPLERFTK